MVKETTVREKEREEDTDRKKNCKGRDKLKIKYFTTIIKNVDNVSSETSLSPFILFIVAEAHIKNN